MCACPRLMQWSAAVLAQEDTWAYVFVLLSLACVVDGFLNHPSLPGLGLELLLGLVVEIPMVDS